MGCAWGRWGGTLPSTPSPFPAVPAKGRTSLPPPKSVWGQDLSPGKVSLSSSLLLLPGQPQLWRIPVPSQPRPWKLFPPFPTAGSRSRRCCPGSSPPELLWGGQSRLPAPRSASPAPLEAAQRRSLPAICCQRLGLETRYKPGQFPSQPAHPAAAPLPHPPLCEDRASEPGGSAGAPARGIRRECAAQDARLSPRCSGTRGLGRDHNPPRLGSYRAALFPGVRGIRARRAKGRAAHIYTGALGAAERRAHSTHTRRAS